jgi:D-alanine-D-alanine ligase
MNKRSVLILYTVPASFFPDGKPDVIGKESVVSRLRSIQGALRTLGHAVQILQAKGDPLSLLKNIEAAKADLIFNLCEEYLGQSRLEMNIAALLEILNIPFTGSSALTLGLSQEKGKTKSILAHHGIPTPAYRVWAPGQDTQFPGLSFPVIVKPNREDASLGIDNDAFIDDPENLRKQIQKIYQGYKQPVLVEEYIDGKELNVSILGNEDPQTLPISEIDFSSLPSGSPKICGYAAKWLEGSPEFKQTIPLCPAVLSKEHEESINDVALRAYQIMDCRDYARVDIRLSPEGVPYVLEINANPDISRDAGMSRSAKAAGLTYSELIGRIVELAWSRSLSAPFLHFKGPEEESAIS